MTSKASAAHILVNDEKKAKEILERIKNGEKFADLAKKHSKCPSGHKGGDLGWFERGDMVQTFERAAFSGEIGSVVGPVKTEFGWHLILVKDKR
ncbi:MAG: peptidyl-prolyl cis-trans isomerase [Methanomassiliicoccaceae archaeon]|nr:peptidyl-prolyl cis-trans isomerase [Methanomassiliicoccaceae archaeon]